MRDDALRANRRTAYFAFAWVMAFLAWHAVWYVTGLGFPSASDQHGAERAAVQVFSLIVVLMVIVGALLPLALAQPWGRRIPRWMLLSAAWTGAVLLAARGVSGVGDDLVRVTGILPKGFTGLTTAQTLGTSHPSFWCLFASGATDVLFTVGGLAFVLAARAYRRVTLASHGREATER
ncbi:DUF3995 domain-containing protein [Actinoallomurus rhizosphaericola]|uniref:DUF3995 domain-containing protein n=1 Tax=Actinoallomurus rhizosphaericola TaxID=2952536 RepID=UPI00209395D1|nr:DUF3995 domain-containing protein [Actinoallomurus rhizosphaericola]MCO5999845.1 DUF3995 domain-containing protein [Actinoallomurus rhizosphaericola]